MPIDPVCHLAVDAHIATERGLTSYRFGNGEHSGDLCYFCSTTCKTLYELQPMKYPNCRRTKGEANPQVADSETPPN